MNRATWTEDHRWIRVSGVARWVAYTDVVLLDPSEADQFIAVVRATDPALADEVDQVRRTRGPLVLSEYN